MSALRVYLDGKPAWLIQEPAQATIKGYGGAMVVGNSAAYHHRKSVAEYKQRQAAEATK